MAAIPVVLNGTFTSDMGTSTGVFIGQLAYSDRGVGGGPIVPTPPSDAHPEHPIYYPPGTQPHPEHPIYYPDSPPPINPPDPPTEGKPPPPGGGWGWHPEYGWGYFPGGGGKPQPPG